MNHLMLPTLAGMLNLFETSVPVYLCVDSILII